MNLYKLGGILEIAGHYQGKDQARYWKATEMLRTGYLADDPIRCVFIRDDSEEPTRVPDFGHDVRCRCVDPLPWGVRRYFGIDLIVETDRPIADLMQLFKVNDDAQFRVSIVENLRQDRHLSPHHHLRAIANG